MITTIALWLLPLDLMKISLKLILKISCSPLPAKRLKKIRIARLNFLHKGIASRSFKLSLRLDEHIDVQQANYENSLLKINLQRSVPEEAMPRKNSNRT